MWESCQEESWDKVVGLVGYCTFPHLLQLACHDLANKAGMVAISSFWSPLGFDTALLLQKSHKLQIKGSIYEGKFGVQLW